jgi:hypothetical protein
MEAFLGGFAVGFIFIALLAIMFAVGVALGAESGKQK